MSRDLDHEERAAVARIDRVRARQATGPRRSPPPAQTGVAQPLHDPDGRLRCGPNCRYFDPKKIGVARYRTAKVTLSKAVDRLVTRGLVERGNNYRATGIRLVVADIEVAS